MKINSAAFHQSKHLGRDDIYPCVDCCPVCLSKEPRESVFLLQKMPDINMLRCKKCGAASASHMPKDAILDDYYGTYYDSNTTQVTFSGLSRFAENILAEIDVSSLPTTLNILDFGGGNGSLSIELAKRILAKNKISKVQITIVDYQDSLSGRENNIIIEHKKSLDDVHGSYDLVLASAILEHIPQLNPVILKIFRSINKGGYLYVRTPYMLPFTRIFKNLDLTYPAHVHDIGSPFWDRVIETFALNSEVVVSRPSIVETSFRDNFIRTLIAYLLKAPGHLEALLVGKKKDRIWNVVGGWEAVLKFK